MDCDDRAIDCELAQIDEWHFVTQNVVPPSEIAALPTVARNDIAKRLAMTPPFHHRDCHAFGSQ